MTSTIIIDDEKNALDVLSMQLNNYCPEISILKTCQSGEDGIKYINDLSPQLVFLDIEMPKINGFDVLDATRHKNYKVIFTTAYDQFAIKAFKYSAIDYLLKPIDIEELKSSVKKLCQDQNSDFGVKFDLLYNQLGLKKNKPDKIALPMGDAYEMVLLSNIIRCESDSNYTTIFLDDQRKVTLSKTLKEVEENLQQSTFYRLHHSHLINLNHITKFYKNDGGYVIMKDGAQISISRSKKDDFFEMMRKL